MASLWRPLALAWLGGIASPLLLDDAAIISAPPTVIVGDPATPAKTHDGSDVDRVADHDVDDLRDAQSASSD